MNQRCKKKEAKQGNSAKEKENKIQAMNYNHWIKKAPNLYRRKQGCKKLKPTEAKKSLERRERSD